MEKIARTHRIPKHLVEKLDKVAADQRRSKEGIVTLALEEWLEKHENG